ncbi:MAG: hypothetical protein ACTS2F_23005 [Thainema sp.]
MNGGEIQISAKNKAILEAANAAIAEGNNEGYLSFCADDTKWTFVGDSTLNGKENNRHDAIHDDCSENAERDVRSQI